MISHPLDQSNPSCAIKFATIFVNQRHKMGIVLLQLGCLFLSVLSVAITKEKSNLHLKTCMFIKNANFQITIWLWGNVQKEDNFFTQIQ